MKSKKPRRKRWSRPNLRAYLQSREHRRRAGTAPSGHFLIRGKGIDGSYAVLIGLTATSKHEKLSGL